MTLIEKRVSIVFGALFCVIIIGSLVLLSGCGTTERTSSEYAASKTTSGVAVSGSSVVSNTEDETSITSDTMAETSETKNEPYSREELERIYRDFAAGLDPFDSKNPAGDYIAVVDAGMPVLLVTDSIIKGDTGKQAKKGYSAHAYMYAYDYNEKKVELIGPINSTGSGYPLLVSNGYVIGGFHHSAKKLTMKDGKGEMEVIDGLYLNKKKLTHTVYSVYRCVEDKVSEDKIEIKDMNDEDKYDYYCSALINEDESYNKDTYIVFKKLSELS